MALEQDLLSLLDEEDETKDSTQNGDPNKFQIEFNGEEEGNSDVISGINEHNTSEEDFDSLLTTVNTTENAEGAGNFNAQEFVNEFNRMYISDLNDSAANQEQYTDRYKQLDNFYNGEFKKELTGLFDKDVIDKTSFTNITKEIVDLKNASLNDLTFIPKIETLGNRKKEEDSQQQKPDQNMGEGGVNEEQEDETVKKMNETIRTIWKKNDLDQVIRERSLESKKQPFSVLRVDYTNNWDIRFKPINCHNILFDPTAINFRDSSFVIEAFTVNEIQLRSNRVFSSEESKKRLEEILNNGSSVASESSSVKSGEILDVNYNKSYNQNKFRYNVYIKKHFSKELGKTIITEAHYIEDVMVHIIPERGGELLPYVDFRYEPRKDHFLGKCVADFTIEQQKSISFLDTLEASQNIREAGDIIILDARMGINGQELANARNQQPGETIFMVGDSAQPSNSYALIQQSGVSESVLASRQNKIDDAKRVVGISSEVAAGESPGSQTSASGTSMLLNQATKIDSLQYLSLKYSLQLITEIIVGYVQREDYDGFGQQNSKEPSLDRTGSTADDIGIQYQTETKETEAANEEFNIVVSLDEESQAKSERSVQIIFGHIMPMLAQTKSADSELAKLDIPTLLEGFNLSQKVIDAFAEAMRVGEQKAQQEQQALMEQQSQQMEQQAGLDQQGQAQNNESQMGIAFMQKIIDAVMQQEQLGSQEQIAQQNNEAKMAGPGGGPEPGPGGGPGGGPEPGPGGGPEPGPGPGK